MKVKVQVKTPEQTLSELPEGEPMTDEEAQISTPYSDLAAWERIIERQLLSGTSRFRGPPGLLERVAARLFAANRTP